MSELETISFASEVKEEITRRPREDDCLRSLCSAFAKTNGTIRLGASGEELDLSTESSNTAKMLYQAFNHLFGISCRFAYTKGMGFHKRVRYHCLVSEAEMVMGDIEVDYFSNKIPKNLVLTGDQEAAYLAGAFLASGSVNSPVSSNYHLEMAFADETYARWLSHLLNKTSAHSFTSKITKRRGKWIVYLKRSDQISNFLILVGATESCLKFENIRIDRDFSNIGNRLSNLDNANMNKTLSASERQRKEVSYFIDKYGYSGIKNEKMKILMKLRLDNPDSSLDDLADKLSDELACTVTKSNVNHLFRKIHEDYLKETNNG